MTRRKGRANGPQGLWQDTPAQPYVPAHDLRFQQTSPLLRACPACHAALGQPCTRRGRGRKPLRDRNHKPIYHPSRIEETS